MADESLSDGAENTETAEDFAGDLTESADLTENAEDSGISDQSEVSDEDPFALPDLDETLSDTNFDLPENENNKEGEDPFALPDLDEGTAENDQTEVSDQSQVADEDPFALPDLDETLSDTNFDLPENESGSDDSFDLPDFDDNETESPKDPTMDSVPVASGLDFDGLYDKETKEGTSYQTDDQEDVRKKTKAPVIICVICAIICIIAVLLLLFIVPSKYNLLGKKNAKNTVDPAPIVKEAEPEPEVIPEPEPEIPDTSAKEDEIVVITEPEVIETVVPELPKEPETPKTITYKIKWGDTLWDIADAYYKNPWKYHMIARYNKIKNPDHIISGTVIELPQQ
ncbi:MAG: LysM peptidoglycan-binding domain-containing protein [Treponema sp.]|nr:LysM peptidoglycan-binding domain-containing protein [Treponema sp.]